MVATIVHTDRPWSSECGVILGGRDRARLKICSCRPWLCEHAGSNRASSEVYLEAVIERVWRYTWRLWSSEIARVLGGRRWLPRRDSIPQLVNSQPSECHNVTSPLKILWWTGGWRSIGREVAQSWSYIQWLTRNHENDGTSEHLRCMLYSMYAALSVNLWWWHGELERDD